MVHHNKETSEDLQQQRESLRNAQLRANLVKRVKTIGIWAICIIAVVLLIGFFVSSSRVDTQNLPTLAVNAVASTDHVKGNTTAKILIVEYSDFQCPACAAYQPLVKKAMEEKGDKFQFVYRNFPLKLIHANAVAGARAAEAAAVQGKFWEMHDKLFENQDKWERLGNPESAFSGFASEIGLDVDKWRADYRSSEVAAKVENDYTSGVRYNIQSTPTFYLNGQPIRFASYEELSALIDRYSK